MQMGEKSAPGSGSSLPHLPQLWALELQRNNRNSVERSWVGLCVFLKKNKARNSLSPRDKAHPSEEVLSAWSPLWLNILR